MLLSCGFVDSIARRRITMLTIPNPLSRAEDGQDISFDVPTAISVKDQERLCILGDTHDSIT
jgi:hypothetical protein